MNQPTKKKTKLGKKERLALKEQGLKKPVVKKPIAKKKAKPETSDKKKNKQRLIFINKQITSSGQRKELEEAKHWFQEIEKEGLTPSAHSYTALLNAHVRSSELDDAEKILSQLNELFEPNVVASTALLKGLLESDFPRAARFWESLLNDPKAAAPNLRTLNTYLRGCVRHGAVTAAEAAVKHLESRGIDGDDTTADYMSQLLAQALRLKECRALQLKSKKPLICVNVASALLCVGLKVKAKKMLKEAKERMESGNTSNASTDTQEGSVQMFLEHQQVQLRQEIEFLQTLPTFDLYSTFHRCLLHRPNTNVGQLVAELESFGLSEILSRRGESRQSIESKIAGVFDSKGMIQFDKMFSRQRTIKMEICSGNGDWVAAQAVADPDSDWMSLELRMDRVHRIFRRAAMVNNLAVLGGDASQILPSWIPSSSVDLIAINFPEPPAWHGGGEGQHLLTPDFLKECRRILKGPLTIFTDNLKYLRSLAASLATDFSSSPRTEHPIATVDGVAIYLGQPDAELGYLTPTASYFDQLWASGKKQKRYFLSVQ